MNDMLNLAGGIILDDEDRVLLLHRNTAKRVQWEIPGGKQDPGESLDEVAHRELEEELGVKVELRRQLGQKIFSEDGYDMSYTWFLAEVTDGTPQVMEEHTFDDLRFFSIEELQAGTIDLSSNTQNFADAVVSGMVSLR